MTAYGTKPNNGWNVKGGEGLDSRNLGAQQEGTIVKIVEKGVAREFIVVQHHYPSHSSEKKGTLLVRKYTGDLDKYDTNSNVYGGSDIDSKLNSTYYNMVETNIRNSIIEVDIPVTAASGSTTVTSIPRKVFMLSLAELGLSADYANKEGTAIPYFNSSQRREADILFWDTGGYSKGPDAYWTRTLCRQYANKVYYYISDSQYGPGEIYTTISGTTSYATTGIRPAFVLPYYLWVLDDGTVSTNMKPWPPYPPFTYSTLRDNQQFTVAWNKSSDPDEGDEVVRYIVERSTDGGKTHTQLYSGPKYYSSASGENFGLSETIDPSWDTVSYRAKCVDTHGAESDYRTLFSCEVIHNLPPFSIPLINVPQSILDIEETIYVTWETSTDPNGDAVTYILERSADNTDYKQVYSGKNSEFSEPLNPLWNTVQYRIKATDGFGGESGYTISGICTIIHNQSPVISGTDMDLGTLADAFPAQEYSVSDPEADNITVTETLDGGVLRSFEAVHGEIYTVAVDAAHWRGLINGKHEVAIEATDGTSQSVRRFLFQKDAPMILFSTKVVESLKQPAVVMVNGVWNMPEGATLTVEACNNAFDSIPIWQDITQQVLDGKRAPLANMQKTANKWGIQIRMRLERGTAAQTCYIHSLTVCYTEKE